MKKLYPVQKLAFASALILLFFIVSCSKSNDNPKPPATATPAKIGFYEIDSANVRELQTVVTKIGSQAVSFDMIFDTGSGGLVVDAQGVLPSTMIGASGLVFTGDSTVVNGITVTSQTSVIEYGADSSTLSKVYGNLAYADITIGDNNGNVTVKRLPFFIYYKAVDAQNTVYPPHEFDVLGVSSEYDITFANNAYITSPFSYYDPGNGLARGFKIAALGTSGFSEKGTYVAAVTLGLTQADLSSNGFNLIDLLPLAGEGYIPLVPGTIAYQNQNFPTEMIFDTGTSPYFYIEDPYWPYPPGALPANNRIDISTSTGFEYGYTVTATDNLTVVENPNSAGGGVSLISLDFFLYNEYLIDFDTHQLGLKNN
jgi:hypothetical protein